jgi:hypothetical protein
MPTVLGLSFRLDHAEANALRERLNQRAGRLGYRPTMGRSAGKGVLSMLLEGWDRGEVVVVRVDPAKRQELAERLAERMHEVEDPDVAELLASITDALMS